MVKTINQLRKEKQHLIDKACEWLKMKAGFTIGIDGATRRDFRDFMEGRSNKQWRNNNENCI